MTDPERAEAVDIIRHDIDHLKRLLRLLVTIVFIALAVISVSTMITVRTSTDARQASKSNTEFLSNFSNYMRCLVINDDEVVAAYGEEAYFNLCDELLFQGTGEKPTKVVVTVPSTTTTTVKVGE